MRIRARRIWLTIHRWIGLTAGLLFVLLGLSGSVLVFHHSIDEWLNPELMRVAEGQSRKPLAEVLAAAEAGIRVPHGGAKFVDVPRTRHGVWTVWFSSGSKDPSGFIQVYVDPASAQVTGSRVWGRYVTSWIYQLHHQLLSGSVGETIVGISGLILIVSSVSGIYLWWPLWRHSWRAAFAIRGHGRLTYDLHKTLGIVGAPLLLVLAFTGVYLVFPGWIKPGVTLFSPETVVNADRLQSQRRSDSVPLTADQAVAAAEAVFPDDELKRLYLPKNANAPYVARVRRAGEVRRSSGNSRIWIDQYDGRVLAVRDWNERTAADSFFAWQFPLHNGEAFGMAGRWVVLVSGLAPALLYVTGCILWWRRHRAQQRQRRRRAVPNTNPGWSTRPT